MFSCYVGPSLLWKRRVHARNASLLVERAIYETYTMSHDFHI